LTDVSVDALVAKLKVRFETHGGLRPEATLQATGGAFGLSTAY